MKRALRMFGILMAVLMVASVAFSGAALADNENSQDSEQNAATLQNQEAGQANVALISLGEQENEAEQEQEAETDQESDQTQVALQVDNHDDDVVDIL